jgi:hypothetical protein
MIGAVMLMGGPDTASAGAKGSDSATWAELRNRLPDDLRAKVERARQTQKVRRDTLARLSPAERNKWVDSLRREAVTRRSEVLQSLSPDERTRMENRLLELEQQEDRISQPRNPRTTHKD